MKKGDLGADWAHARPPADWLKAQNLKFAFRYLIDEGRDKGKGLEPPEVQTLSNAGIYVCANFEYAIHPIGTAAQGARDARTALAELQYLDAPRRIVYFSFDYDVQNGDLQGCLNYLNGAASVLGKENVGAYGNYRLINFLGGQGFHWLWQCYAWSYGKWSSYATVRQTHNNHWPGQHDADLNVAMVDDIGGWLIGQPGNGQEIDMDMSTPTPSGGDTNGRTVGEMFGVMARGANAAAAAKAGTEALAAIVRDFIVSESSSDADFRALLLSRTDAVLAAVQADGVDTDHLAALIGAELGPELALELGAILTRTHLTVTPAS